jgi:hypothetical protein
MVSLELCDYEPENPISNARFNMQLYPLELECDDPPVKKPAVTMNAEAREFRPKRKAAKEAEKLFKNIAEFELES